MSPLFAVVPGYYLVCYNYVKFCKGEAVAVVPGYYLVCYNQCPPECGEGGL